MDIDLVHARWQLGTLAIEEAARVASWALALGFDGPALRELAWSHESWSEVNGVFAQAMQEMGRLPLALDEAVTTLVTHLAVHILSGDMSPAESADLVYHDLIVQDLRVELSDPIRQFISLADAYGAALMFEEPAMAESSLTQLLEVSRTLVTTGLEPELSTKTEQTGLEPSLE